jgi:isocitrate dehydrogenase (NAD+)
MTAMSATRVVTLIPGDGIGPEVTNATLRVLEAADAGLEWDRQIAGAEAVEAHGEPLPKELMDSILRTGLALKGPVTTPVGKGFQSVNVQLRQALTLFANVRPARTLPGIFSRYENVDLLIFRENTEGLYRGIEHTVIPGVVESIKIVTAEASERIARFAFEWARREGRKRLTAVHKANILKLSDGLFLDSFRKVALEYPDFESDDRIIDALCMGLVKAPEQFDVLVLPNLYGDIVSDLAAGLVGGLGVTPGANIGTEVAVFEAVHGSAPDIAGQNKANPLALIRSAIMMLRHIDRLDVVARVRGALWDTIVNKQVMTGDLGGSASTTEFTDEVVRSIEAGAQRPAD